MSAPGQPISGGPVTRVLLADGNKIGQTHLRSLLEKSGYEVVCADVGTQALAILEADNPPSLALLDWAMPGLDGLEICRRIRRGPPKRSTYIILLTPWSQQNDRVKGLEAGADDCIFNPPDTRELRIRLQTGAKIILERALRESEERFYNSFEHAGIGMAVMTVGGEFQQTNRALCNLLGYTAEELRGVGFHGICHREDAPSSRTLLLEFIEGGELRTGEFERRFITKASGIVRTSLTISLVLDSDDLPACFVFQSQDITERRRAQEALKESLAASKQALKELADQKYAMDQHAIVATTDVNGTITYINDKFCAISKYSREELLGQNHRIVNSGYHSGEFFRNMYETIATGQVWHNEICNLAKDGTHYWVDTTIVPFLGSDGKPRQYVAIRSDITERKTAEEALHAAYEETELFVQSIPSILIGLDHEGRIIRWNFAAGATFGLLHGQAMGRSMESCGIHWLHPDIKTEIARWIATEVSCRCDDVSYEKDGIVRFLGLNVRRIPGKSYCPGFVVTGADITERKGLEDQLRQAQKLEAIGQMAAGIAHEINTPTQYTGDNLRFLKDSWDSIAEFLNFCGTLSEQALTATVTSETLDRFETLHNKCDFPYLLKEIPHAIDQSLEGLQRVAKIVRGMKEFSHPGSKDKRPVNLNRAIETTITVSRNEWKYCADLVTAFDEDLPLVPCLVGEFNQVILNLIVNAGHAIAAAEAENGHKGTITISTLRQGEWAEVGIADTGLGIPKDIQARVFEPFFTTKEVGKGTGQGLALAHSVIVTQHQGQIWFDSEVGRGTTFHIRLPLDSESATP